MQDIAYRTVEENLFEEHVPSTAQRLFKALLFGLKVRAFTLQLVCLLASGVFVFFQVSKAVRENDRDRQVRLCAACILLNLTHAADFLLWPALRFVPFYFEIKLVLLVYALNPRTNGAWKLYKNALEPQFRGLESAVDPLLTSLSRQMEPHLGSLALATQAKVESTKLLRTGNEPKNPAQLRARAVDAIRQTDSFLQNPAKDARE